MLRVIGTLMSLVELTNYAQTAHSKIQTYTHYCYIWFYAAPTRTQNNNIQNSTHQFVIVDMLVAAVVAVVASVVRWWWWRGIKWTTWWWLRHALISRAVNLLISLTRSQCWLAFIILLLLCLYMRKIGRTPVANLHRLHYRYYSIRHLRRLWSNQFIIAFNQHL